MDGLTRARALGMCVIEHGWALGFRASGQFARGKPRAWEARGGQRVLIVAPHPDDEVVGCGGAIVLHERACDRVCVVFVSDGRKSRAWGLDADEMARRRRSEANAAVRILGVERHWLGLREGEWQPAEFGEVLQDILRAYSPELVYAPSRVDFHPEHLRVAQTLARVLAETEKPTWIRVYPVQVPLTRLLCNCVAPVAPARAQIIAALEAYATQRGSTYRTLRARHYAACLYRLPEMAEEFWEMDAARYVRLHHAPLENWDTRGFRSLRATPFTDPLAYWYGRRERERLRTSTDA